MSIFLHIIFTLIFERVCLESCYIQKEEGVLKVVDALKSN